MSERHVRRVLGALAAVNLLFFGGWIALEARARQAPAVRLPVEGYDPRDLLSGHYVRFRLAAEREAQALLEGQPPPGGAADFCLEPGQDALWHVSGRRAGPQGCQPFLRGEVDPHGEVRFGAERYYVDERRAPEVQQVVAGPGTYLVATLDGAGAVHALDLVVGGRSLAAPR